MRIDGYGHEAVSWSVRRVNEWHRAWRALGLSADGYRYPFTPPAPVTPDRP